ncbi:hypothetical protein KM92DES2_11613 [uncultured Desulfovibrio sp.]|uniref:Uncharacterized protein n=1 Tax=uncultured Desulfovibrio sp. TaxID=167968 RepID=A0A212JS34_9BACT|nr:hypothetical protein KM92DES2_11613 [uncultured Desulfovibrio sp.]
MAWGLKHGLQQRLRLIMTNHKYTPNDKKSRPMKLSRDFHFRPLGGYCGLFMAASTDRGRAFTVRVRFGLPSAAASLYAPLIRFSSKVAVYSTSPALKASSAFKAVAPRCKQDMHVSFVAGLSNARERSSGFG